MVANSAIVVVVEDESLVRGGIVDAFEERGYTVLEARDARLCMELIRCSAQHVGLLLTDVVLPGPMSGLDLAYQAQARWPWINVIVASAVSIGAGELPPGVRYIPKPYDPFHLVDQVQGLSASLDET